MDDDAVVDNLELVGCEAGTFSCTWKLKDFSKVCATPKIACRSKLFKDVGRPYLSTTLLFYPGGQDFEHQDESTCYLKFRKNHNGIYVKPTISFCSSKGEVIAERCHPWTVLCRELRCIGPEGVQRPKLIEKVASDDVLLLKAEVAYSYSNFTNDKTEKSFSAIYRVGLLPDFFNNIVTRMPPDFVISSSSNDHHVHKVVLISHSKIFADMLNGNKDMDHLNVDSFKSEVVEAMIFFLYNARLLDFRLNALCDLILIAHKFGIDSMKVCCHQIMISATPKYNDNFTTLELVTKFGAYWKLQLPVMEIVDCLASID